MSQWYVAPGGLDTNPGTLVDPWDIESALVNQIDVQPGDTIWIRGGTYYHPDRSWESKGYGIDLRGTSDSPITIRSYAGERATIDGGLHSDANTAPEHVRIRDLEVIVSEVLTQSRVSTESGSHPSDLVRPWGGIDLVTGKDIKLINNVIHGNAQGVGLWIFVTDNSEAYGNLIYDNGWIGTDRYHGAGLYAQNDSTSDRLIVNNIILDNYGIPLQAYGSEAAYVDRFIVDKNIISDLIGDRTFALIGGARPSEVVRVRDNVSYGSNIRVGYVDGGGDAIVTGNTALDAEVQIRAFANLEEADNWSWPLGYVVPTNGAPIPNEPVAFLHPNEYDPSRAHLAVMALQDQSAADVDFSGFLEVGDRFQLKAPTDFFGPSVFTGEYTGSPTSIPISGRFSSYVALKLMDKTNSNLFFVL